MTKLKTAVSLILFFAVLPLKSQSLQTLSGYILDAESGEPLIGAAALTDDSVGAITNNFGYYTLTIQPQKGLKVVFSSLGYEEKTFTLDFESSRTLSVRLNPSKELLSASKVTATHTEVGVRGTQMSAIEVPVDQIRAIPAFGGEVDLIKALQLLPGVQSGTEGAAGLYVRGGGPDENLLLLDGVPLYNVNHLFGFYSVFNADAVKNVTLYKGSFPARYGSRLSSIVDVRMKDGNDKKVHGSISVGTLAAKINLEGPIVKGRTTFNVSARRTYGDALLQPIIRSAARRDGSVRGRPSAGYYFYDINAKITHRFSDYDKVFISLYNGNDVTYLNYSDSFTSSLSSSEAIVKSRTEDKTSLRWMWGNTVGALRWNHVFGAKLFMNASLSATSYDHRLRFALSERENHEITSRSSIENESISSDISMTYDSGIRDFGGRVELEYVPVPSHNAKFGAEYIHHAFNPSVSSQAARISLNGEALEKLDTSFGDSRILSGEYSIYAEDNWSALPRLKVNLGARAAVYSTPGKTYGSFEPRVSARFLLCENVSLKASYSRMSQFLHLLSNTSLSLPTDLWVPVTRNLRPMCSHQGAVGAFFSFGGGYDASLEGYCKTMDNVMEYKDGASFFGTTSGWEEKVVLGKGWSYGLEAFIQKKFGKFTGWLGYTLARSMRKFDREGQELNDGKPFPAKYDRIHDLSATMSYKPGGKCDISLTFVYGTGTTGSLAYRSILAPQLGPDGFFNYTGTEYLDGRNNYRLPPYMRVDFGTNFYKKKKHGTRVWNVSIYNATNRQNPFLLYVSENDDNEKALMQISIFPMLPSISYRYEF